MYKIKSIEELKKYTERVDGGMSEFYMFLSSGLARSCKRISFETSSDNFCIHNEIDDTWQEDLKATELEERTMIVEAINKGVFFIAQSSYEECVELKARTPFNE